MSSETATRTEGAPGPRVLITGANGNIGRVLRARLRAPDIRFTDVETLDLAERGPLPRRFAGHHTVIHLATTLGRPGPRVARAAESVRLARNVVRAARASGVRRVVLMSSIQAAPRPAVWRGRQIPWNPETARTGWAIERLGQWAARQGADIIVLRCGGVSWPDHPARGVEEEVWLSHEDCAGVFRACIDDRPLVPGRCVVFAAVSDTRRRKHPTGNPLGWRSITRSLGSRRARLRLIQLKSFLKVLRDRALSALRPGSRLAR